MNTTKWLGVVVLTVCVGGAIFYFYWKSTPLFALQESGQAIEKHDLAMFQKNVDLDTLIDNALQDLLFNPLSKIPDLDEMQTKILHQAGDMAKKKIKPVLIAQADQFVSGAPSAATAGSTTPEAAPAADAAASGPEAIMQTRLPEMKQMVSQKLDQYSHAYPKSLPGRILSLSSDERKIQLKTILTDYGFAPKNFRGLASGNDLFGGDYKKSSGDSGNDQDLNMYHDVGLKFYSPKLSKDVVVDIEMVKTADGWRISHLANLGKSISELEPTYDNDIQELTRYAFAGVRDAVASSVKQAADQLRSQIKEQIKEKVSEAASELRQQAAAKLNEMKENLPPLAPGNGPPSGLPFPPRRFNQ